MNFTTSAVAGRAPRRSSVKQRDDYDRPSAPLVGEQPAVDLIRKAASKKTKRLSLGITTCNSCVHHFLVWFNPSAVATAFWIALHVGCTLGSRATATLATGVLAAGLLVAACGGGGTPGAANAGPAIRVSGGAGNNEFSFTPSEIRVPAGQAILVEFVNEGKILHDFSTRGQGANVTLVAAPGSSRSGIFTSDGQGRYEFFCGQAGHEPAGMKATLIVE